MLVPYLLIEEFRKLDGYLVDWAVHAVIAARVGVSEAKVL